MVNRGERGRNGRSGGAAGRVSAVTTPAATTPAATTPAVTTPAATAPALTAPPLTAPPLTTTAVTAPAARANPALAVIRAAVIGVAGAAAAAALIAWCRPGSVSADAGDPTSAIVVVACWLAWLGAAYLALATVAAALAHVPGVVGRLGATLETLAPPALRRTVQIGVGVVAATGILVGPTTATAAPPSPGASTAPAATSLDWPGLSTPTSARPAAEAPIVVRTGDSLWAISAHLLGPRGSASHIARLWPRVYAANRAVIGPDPDLIRPGQRLRATTALERTPR